MRASAASGGWSAKSRVVSPSSLTKTNERVPGEELLRRVHQLEHEERGGAHRVGDVAEHDQPRLVAAAPAARGLEGDAARAQALPEGAVRIDAPAQRPPPPHPLGAAQPLGEAAHRAPHLLALGLGEPREGHRLRAPPPRPRRLGDALREGALDVHAHPPAGPLQLLGERARERRAALLAERLAQRGADAAERARRAREPTCSMHPAARRSRSGARLVMGASARAIARGEEEVVELALGAEQPEQRGRVARDAAPLGGGLEQLAQRGELGGGEAAGAEAAPEVARVGAIGREEGVERLAEASAIGAPLDHHGRDRVAQRPRDRRSRPAPPTRTASIAWAVEMPNPSRRRAQQELVEDAQHRPSLYHGPGRERRGAGGGAASPSAAAASASRAAATTSGTRRRRGAGWLRAATGSGRSALRRPLPLRQRPTFRACHGVGDAS